MSIRENIIAAADNELSSRRRQAGIRAGLRKEEALRQYPVIGRMNARVNYIGLRENYLALGERVPDSIVRLAGEANSDVFTVSPEELPALKQKAEAERQKEIKAAGLEALFCGANVYCPVCGDRGGSDCGCYTKILAEKILDSSGLPEGSETLSDVGTAVYPPEADKTLYGAAESPRTQAENCIRRTGEFLRGEGGEKNKKLLLISGQVGVGKTWLAAAAGREAAENCMFVCYRKTPSLFDDMLLAGSYSDEEEDRAAAQDRREYAEEADLLIIDDLGIEVVSGKKIEYLITLIDLRAGAGRKTVVTSNLALSDIAREYGERLASRFADRDNSTCLRLIGPDLRLRRKV